MSGTGRRPYVHTLFERIWHLVHALAVSALIVTGINLRFGSAVPLFGLRNAVELHNLAGKIVVADFVLWILYTLASRRIRFYVPRGTDLAGGVWKQLKFYGGGNFREGSGPFPVTESRKFNPVRKWTYISVMFGMVPLLIVTGVILMIPGHGGEGREGKVHLAAVIHRLLAYFMVAFLVVHTTMAAMGRSFFERFRSIITGYAEREGE